MLMESFTDEQLISIYQNNLDGTARVAFGILYERYAKQMLHYFFYSLHNDNEKAQDFVHDLFLKIIEKNHTFNTNMLFKPWIYRIASNMCKNEYRSEKVAQKYNVHVMATSDQTDIQDERENILRQCINKLNQEQRSLIVMRFNLKLKIKEIAEIYECAEGTVKSRLFYATKELSKFYKE
jgi:RNA polymerase sigma-70 factor, ECF subfamily